MRTETRRSLAFLAPSAYPLGGVADWLDYVMVGLTDCGWKCQLLLVKGPGHDAERYLERHPWPDVQLISNRTGSREGRIRALLSAIDRSCADVVISVNLVDAYEAIRRKRARDGGAPPKVVMALHGLELNLMEDIRREIDVLDGVIATNRLSVAIASKAIAADERVYYAPYGVPVSSSLSEFQSPGRQLKLLYAGRIEQEQKRVLDLPKIVCALRSHGIDASLSIAGAGPLVKDLQEAFDRLNIADSVNWLGDLNSKALADAYRSHDALMITSEWETGPLVAFEAMARGVPVVAANFEGRVAGEVLRDSETCLVYPVGDLRAAAHCIHRLVVDPELHARMGAAGRALVEATRSVDLMVDRWCEAFEGTMNRRSNHCARAVRNSRNIARGHILGLRIPGTLSAGIRRVFDRPITHKYASDEWPFYYLDLTQEWRIVVYTRRSVTCRVGKTVPALVGGE